MLFEMMAGAALAAAAMQDDTAFSTFDNGIPGWTVVRRTDGCFTFSDASSTIVTVFYRTSKDGDPLLLLFSDPAWMVREENVAGYRVQFVGASGDWVDLSGSTFPDEGEPGEEKRGVVTMPFSADAIGPMLTDFAEASSLNFYRDGRLLARVPLDNSARAMRRLLDCARAAGGQNVPSLPTR
ncbi:MAG: hypothetical protein KF780_05890 [Sphingomonas sp.]|nr:hypothetical protein [Sphingomonas sp.]